jgi:hypothetical protein
MLPKQIALESLLAFSIAIAMLAPSQILLFS